MNSVDYGNTISRQGELYRKGLDEQRRAHKEEIESLNNTHEIQTKNQTTSHNKQLRELEKSTEDVINNVNSKQNEALRENNKKYETALNKYQDDFHKERTDNLKNWDRKMTEVKDQFKQNLEDTHETNSNLRNQMKKNYEDSIVGIRKGAKKDLDEYVRTRNAEKKESDLQFRSEKNDILREHAKEKAALMNNELEKRNFLHKNALADITESRELAENRFIEGRNLSAAKFDKLKTDTDNKVEKQMISREEELTSAHQDSIQKQNIAFRDRLTDIDRQNSRNLRELQYQKRAETVSNNEESKQIQQNYRDNLQKQIEKRSNTVLNERLELERNYQNKLTETVDSFKDVIRDHNVDAGERQTELRTRLIEENRQDKYDDAKKRVEMQYEHQNALNFEAKKNVNKENLLKKNSNEKVANLKESFNKSLQRAEKQSKETFQVAQEAMRAEKRQLAKRLHEQNSEQNAFIRETFNEKIDKLSSGYEKRIQQLELQNEMLLQNTNDTVRDVVRKTNVEIERQRTAAQASAESRVKAERRISAEKEVALNDKLKNLEASFTKKMNDQTLVHQKKLKDTQFELTQKLNDEVSKYKDIIDQNNKFMAREIQRLQLASSTERNRLITQYEDRIAKLQKVFKEKSQEVEQFNQLNRA